MEGRVERFRLRLVGRRGLERPISALDGPKPGGRSTYIKGNPEPAQSALELWLALSSSACLQLVALVTGAGPRQWRPAMPAVIPARCAATSSSRDRPRGTAL